MIAMNLMILINDIYGDYGTYILNIILIIFNIYYNLYCYNIDNNVYINYS